MLDLLDAHIELPTLLSEADQANLISFLVNGFPYGVAGAVIITTIGVVVDTCFSEDGCVDLTSAGNYSFFE